MAASTFKIALAQLNPTVGDVAGNEAKVREARGEAARLGADLVMLPELFLAGYPPEDLVLKPAFQDACRQACETLARETADGGPAVLVGSSKWITPRPDDGTYCGPGCLNDLAEREGFERINGQVYRVLPESYGTAAYDAAMERGIAVLRERGEEMTLGDVNQLARTLLSEHPVFIVGDSVTLNSAQDVELLAR